MLALRWFCEYTRRYFDLFWPKPVGSTRNTQLQEKQEQQEPQEQQEQQEMQEQEEQSELQEQLELLGHVRLLLREQQERQLLTELLELQEQEERQLRQRERQQQLEHKSGNKRCCMSINSAKCGNRISKSNRGCKSRNEGGGGDGGRRVGQTTTTTAMRRRMETCFMLRFQVTMRQLACSFSTASTSAT